MNPASGPAGAALGDGARLPDAAADAAAAAGIETRAFVMTLKPGMRDEYRRRHDAIWPELAQALRAAGVLDYWIFLDERSHQLFAFMQHRRDHSLDLLPASPVMQQWWAYMADLMATDSACVPLQAPLSPVFHLV
jgi:L-rhamnose mutarotase